MFDITTITLDSFYPYCFTKSDKLVGMDDRHGTIFMGILMDEFEGEAKKMSEIYDDGYVEGYKDASKEFIEDFQDIRKRIVLKMEERYGKTAKGMEYLKSLFEEEFEKWEAMKG